MRKIRKPLFAGLAPAFALSASPASADTQDLSYSRERLSACVAGYAGQNLEMIAQNGGTARRLARHLIAKALNHCEAETRAFRAATSYRVYADELRELRRFYVDHYALRIEDERASAI